MFGRKKKQEVHNGDTFLAHGIYLKTPEMENGKVVINCFLRCIIVFLLTFGSIGGFLSCFSISYNFVVVALCFLALSMYFAFIYAMSKLILRDVGYIVFFAGFVYTIMLLRMYANSGLYVIVNRVLAEAKNYFDLAGVSEYEVLIDNDVLTVTVVSVFIGMVIIIILNIWINSAMSILWSVFLTFPLLVVPLYMELTPDPLYVVMLGTGYLAVAIFKASGHYIAYAWDKSFRVKGLKKDKVVYTQDGKVFRQVLGTVVLLVFATVIVTELIFPYSTFQKSFKNDSLRAHTKDVIGNFLLLGFSGLYNHYASVGGISGGQLGGVSRVRPDYQPDLIVTFTPYTNEAMYFKAYTGGEYVYGENRWEGLYSDAAQNKEKNGQEKIFYSDSNGAEAYALETAAMRKEAYSASGKMYIKNVGANSAYLYYPYYTVFDDYSIYNNNQYFGQTQGIPLGELGIYNYYPKQNWDDVSLDVLPKDIHSENVDDIYLQVPDENKEVLASVEKEMRLNKDMTEGEVIATIQNYFAENIPYTLNPGATPNDEDFVNYFLTDNKKGYCAHFATSATLLLRDMGIPARYVEGYAINFENILTAEENQYGEYKDYFKGYSIIGESALLDVEVTDANAHAWVEVYVDGFGWAQIEVTPGSNEASDETDFWSAFANAISGANIGNGNGGLQLGEIHLSEYRWILWIILGLAAAFECLQLMLMMIRKGKRFATIHQKNKTEALIAYYADLCQMIRLCNSDFNHCRSHKEQLAFMKDSYYPIQDVDGMCEKLELISFSMKTLSAEELAQMRGVIRYVRRSLWKCVNLGKKWKLLKR